MEKGKVKTASQLLRENVLSLSFGYFVNVADLLLKSRGMLLNTCYSVSKSAYDKHKRMGIHNPETRSRYYETTIDYISGLPKKCEIGLVRDEKNSLYGYLSLDHVYQHEDADNKHGKFEVITFYWIIDCK